jgi:protein SCO1/2
LALLFAIAGCSGSGTGSAGPTPQRTEAPFHGVTPDQPALRPTFTLTDLDGAQYEFAAQTKGRPTYLYFGYTNCPDECPTAMADVIAALRRAAAKDRERALVVFVTTDPARDTAAVLRRFLGQFAPDIIGLRGTQAEVDAAQDATGIPVAKPEGPIPTVSGNPNQHAHEPGTAAHQHFGPLGYGVAHANLIFAYDVRDTLPVAYPGGVTVADIAADLPLLLGRAAGTSPS